MRLFSSLALLLVSAFSAFGADALPALYKPTTGDWSLCGVRGGIPNYPTATTLNPGATTAQIQSAIDNCPNNSAVRLTAGTYNLGSLRINRDRVVLRGDVNANGVPTTILNFTGSNGWALIDLSKTSYPEPSWAAVSSTNRSINSGATRGSTSIVVNSTPTGLQVGQTLIIDSLEHDPEMTQSKPPTTEGGNFGRNENRPHQEYVVVTSISGTTINFTPSLQSNYWGLSGISPGCWWLGSGTSLTTTLAGLENLKISRPTSLFSSHNIAIGPAFDCWVKNVWSTQCMQSHVHVAFSNHVTVADCWFRLHDNVASATYDVWTEEGSYVRVENNICQTTPSAIMFRAGTMFYAGYNFSIDFPYSQPNWLPECMFTHGGFAELVLWEGNRVPSFWADLIHGNSAYQSYIRNRVIGWDANPSQGVPKTDSTRCINAEAQQANCAALGNALGKVGLHNNYESGDYFSIFNIGGNTGWIRKGNYNTVSGTIPASESLGADTVSNSYVYSGSSRPEHWGDRPWPYVTPTNFAQSDTDTNSPAGYRFATAGNPWPAAAGGDTLPPTVSSSSVNAAGTQLTINFSEGVQFGAGGSGGFTLNMNGGTSVLSAPSGMGTSAITFNISRVINAGETGSISYAPPGNGWQDLATPPNLLASIASSPVVNSSTIGPALSSATINAAGNQLVLVFSQSVQAGAGGSGGWTLNVTPAATLGTMTGVGSNTLTYNIGGRVINTGETVTVSYVQPGDGIESVGTGTDVASIASRSVTNNSTQGAAVTPVITLPAGPYFGTQSTTITSPDTGSGAVIRYTVDGSTPNASSTLYSTPISIASNMSLKAIAIWSGHNNSGIASSDFEVLSWVSVGTTWKTFVVPQQTGTFTWKVSIAAPAANSDAGVGIGPSPVSNYTGMGCVILFDNDLINASSGNTYTPGPAYTPGVTYNFVATINVSAHTWTLTSTPASGGTISTIATNAAFKPEQIGAAQLSSIGINGNPGILNVSAMSFSSGLSSARYIGLRGVPASGGATP